VVDKPGVYRQRNNGVVCITPNTTGPFRKTHPWRNQDSTKRTHRNDGHFCGNDESVYDLMEYLSPLPPDTAGSFIDYRKQLPKKYWCYSLCGVTKEWELKDDPSDGVGNDNWLYAEYVEPAPAPAKFAVGDLVVLENPSHNYHRKGTVTKIKSIDLSGDCWLNGGAWCHSQAEFRHATPAEKAKFYAENPIKTDNGNCPHCNGTKNVRNPACEATHRECKECGQEWFTNVLYSSRKVFEHINAGEPQTTGISKFLTHWVEYAMSGREGE